MRYVISDIHGCKKEYLQLLDKINFTDNDHLFVLGDALDRGFDPIGVLKDMMERENVTFIIGNHDYLFSYFIKQLGWDLMDFKSEDEKWDFRSWVKDGGLPTMDSFLELELYERQKIYEYLQHAKWYEELECNGKRYILVHAGIGSFDENKPLNEYDCLDFIYERMNYAKQYYSDDNTYIISGHTPTPFIRADGKPEVLMNANHIAIDCGCVYGGRLAAYCIETGETVYVEKHK